MATATREALSVEPLEAAPSEPVIVRLAQLPIAALPRCMHALLELVSFAPTEPQFLTVAVTHASTVTIVAECASLAALVSAAPDVLEVDETDWSVVRVGEGIAGFASIGVVERLSAPLAKAGIPVLYYSTYSTDVSSHHPHQPWALTILPPVADV